MERSLATLSESEDQQMSSSQSIIDIPITFPALRDSDPGFDQRIEGDYLLTPLHDTEANQSSSKLTSSDKLSALPTPTPRPARPQWPLQQQHRPHSIDATTSLPSFPAANELDTPQHGSWGTQKRRRGGTSIRLAESSPGKETSKPRVSFESERGTQPTGGTNRVGQAFSRLVGGRASDHSASPNPPRPAEASPPGSRPQSRAASPLRMFHQWSSGRPRHHRHHHVKEEPFVPVNPFKTAKRRRRFSLVGIFSPHTHPNIELGDGSGGSGSSSSGAFGCEDVVPVASIKAFLEDAQIFITDTLPRQVYLHTLLCIPAMYFSRVSRIFQDAEVSRPEVQKMIDAMCVDADKEDVEASSHPSPLPELEYMQSPGSTATNPSPAVNSPLPFPDEWTPATVSPSLYRFKHSWETFIDSLIKEWKTLNVVSALLSSAILSIFQIPEAGHDPVTRTLALVSLICSLMSLSYGCMYIVRFSTMRSMFRASRWADEARKTKTMIVWNVWVMLAMPAVWISWAMLFFLASILSFVWRTGSETDPEDRPPLSRHAILGPRIVITAVFALGMMYLVMIIRTLKRYGSAGTMQGMYMQPGIDRRDRLVHLGSSPGETPAPGNALSLSRLRTPESDKEAESRGRKRQRVDLKDAGKAQQPMSASPGKAESLGPEKEGGFLKDINNLKGLDVVTIQLAAANSGGSNL